jgi:hypothetical protein
MKTKQAHWSSRKGSYLRSGGGAAAAGWDLTLPLISARQRRGCRRLLSTASQLYYTPAISKSPHNDAACTDIIIIIIISSAAASSSPARIGNHAADGPGCAHVFSCVITKRVIFKQAAIQPLRINHMNLVLSLFLDASHSALYFF